MDHLAAALGAEEALLDLRLLGGLVVEQPDAVVARLHVELILVLGMQDDFVYLVALDFFVDDFEVVRNIKLLVVYSDSKDSNVPLAVAHEQSVSAVERQSVGVPLLQQVLVVFGQLLMRSWSQECTIFTGRLLLVSNS